MQLLKSKKGFVYFAAMILVTLIVLTKAFIVLSEKQDKLPNYPIGSQQFSLIRLYQDTNTHMTNLNLAVHESANFVYYDLARKGGKNFKRETLTSSHIDCGTYGGYELWSNSQLSDIDCFPDYDIYFKESLNEKLKTVLGLYSLPVIDFEIGMIPYNDYLKIFASSSSQLQISKPIIESSTIKEHVPVTNAYLEKNPTKGGISYNDVHAINGKYCTPIKDKEYCTFLTEEEFKNLYYITDLDAAHLEMANHIKKGNALTFDMGQALLDIAQSWHDTQCTPTDSDCKAKVYVSSISTGKHSANSQHNKGNAVDIAGCRDASGTLYNAESKSSTFLACYDVIKKIMKTSGTYIYLSDCVIYDKQSKRTIKCSGDYSSSHQDHVHIHIT